MGRLLEQRVPEVFLVVVPETDPCLELLPPVPVPELGDVLLGLPCFTPVPSLDDLSIPTRDEGAVTVVVAHAAFGDEATGKSTTATVTARKVVSIRTCRAHRGPVA